MYKRQARDLVDVVCDPGYLTDEPELFFRWLRLYFHTHDEIADDFSHINKSMMTTIAIMTLYLCCSQKEGGII